MMHPVVALFLLPGPGFAAPSCPVSEIRKRNNDNCRPAAGRVVRKTLAADPALTVASTLTGIRSVGTTSVRDPEYTTLMAMTDRAEHRFRMQPDRAFDRLGPTPGPDAPGGHDRTLYRGRCLEG